MGQTWAMISPPRPTLTEKNLPDQAGKVFIVTGASSGLGLELAYILYLHNAKVYIAARDATKITAAISTLQIRVPHSTGSLHPLILDFSDLSTLKPATTTFLASNTRLDVLFLNAGVMFPPQGSTTTQGHELQLGVNTLAPLLLTLLLHPLLTTTAASSPANTVRTIWVSSSAAELLSPRNGLDLQNLTYHDDKSPYTKYGVSKAGDVFLASEYGRRHASRAGIVSISLDPGGLKTDLQRHMPWWQMLLLGRFLREPIFGAYTELWAGLDEGVTVQRNGAFVAPFGNWKKQFREDLVLAMKGKEEGGSAIAEGFWVWSEEQIKEFL